MNNKTILTISTIILSIIFNSLQAQFSIEINTGYAAPLYYTGKNKVYEQDYEHRYKYRDTTFTETRKYNMGNGISFGSAIGYQTKKGLKFGIDVFYLNNKDINFLYNNFRKETYMQYSWNIEDDIPIRYSKYEQYVAFYASRFSISPQIGYVHSFNKSFLEYSIGLSISDITVYANINDYSETITTSTLDGLQYDPDSLFYNLIEHISMSKSNERIFTPYFQLKYNYKFNPNFSLSIAASASPFMSFNKDKGVFYYSSEREVYGDRETFYEREYNSTFIVHPWEISERYNLNVLNFSIGLRYTFVKN